MKCPRCGEDLSSVSQFCSKCGTFLGPVEREIREAPSRAALVAPQTRRRRLAYGSAAALLAIIVAALLIKTAMSRGQSVTQTGGLAPGAGPSVTNAPPPLAGPGPSITNAPTPVPPPPGHPMAPPPKAPPPEDILAYLEFVKQIEAARQMLLKDTGRALSMTTGARGIEKMLDWVLDEGDTPADPLADLKKELGTHTANWQELTRRFDSRPAPAACAQFAGAYRAVLATEQQALVRVVTIVNGTSSSSRDSMEQSVDNLQKLKADPNTQGGIDRSVETADGSLSELCSRVGIEKPFTVKKETEVSGSLTGGL